MKPTSRRGRTPTGKGRFAKGNQFAKGKGRPPGSKDKFTTNMKQMALNALNDERVGGEEGFIEWILQSKKNRASFYTWLMKNAFPTNIDVTLPKDTIIKVISALPRPGAKKPKSEEKK